jgi:SAM-dependent methyltransferase
MAFHTECHIPAQGAIDDKIFRQNNNHLIGGTKLMTPDQLRNKHRLEKEWCEGNEYIPDLEWQFVGWENAQAQLLRFDVLLSAVKLEGKSLLDVGCGVGNLLEYLNQRNISVDYTGVDLIERMISLAQSKNLKGSFYHLDLFESNPFPNHSFDIVFASGIFCVDFGNNEQFLKLAINTMATLAREAIVFNFLHKNSPDKELGFSYSDPMEIKLMVEKLLSKAEVSIIEGYLDNDFTVVCRLNAK